MKTPGASEAKRSVLVPRRRSLYAAISKLDEICTAASTPEKGSGARSFNKTALGSTDLDTSMYSLVYPEALRTVKQNISKGKINSPVLRKIIVEELTLKEELKALDSALERNRKGGQKRTTAEKTALGGNTLVPEATKSYLLSETKREVELFHQTLLKVGYTRADLGTTAREKKVKAVSKRISWDSNQPGKLAAGKIKNNHSKTPTDRESFSSQGGKSAVKKSPTAGGKMLLSTNQEGQAKEKRWAKLPRKSSKMPSVMKLAVRAAEKRQGSVLASAVYRGARKSTVGPYSARQVSAPMVKTLNKNTNSERGAEKPGSKSDSAAGSPGLPKKVDKDVEKMKRISMYQSVAIASVAPPVQETVQPGRSNTPRRKTVKIHAPTHGIH